MYIYLIIFYNLNYLILGVILKYNYLFIFIYLFIYLSLLSTGKTEYMYCILINQNKLINIKESLFRKIYNLISLIIEYILFYILAYAPFLGLFRWNLYYMNKIKQKFKYSLRINHIIYKYEFIYNDEIRDYNGKNIFNHLYAKWLITFSYSATIYLIYFKIVFRLFFNFLNFFIYFIFYLIMTYIYINIWALYLYDILRYIYIYFKIYILKIIKSNFINKIWLILDYMKLQFIYIIYNIPYFFYISAIITFFNFLYTSLFSFYNRFKFESKTNDNIIPYKLSRTLLNKYMYNIFYKKFNYISTNLLLRLMNLIYLLFYYYIIKIINYNYKLLNFNYNIIIYKFIWINLINKIYNKLAILKNINNLFYYIGLINLIIIKIINLSIIKIINFLYILLTRQSKNIIYIILILIIIFFWLDFYNLLIGLKLISLIKFPIDLLIYFINNDLYNYDLWYWSCNKFDISYNFNNHQLNISAYKKFITLLELQKVNYITLFTNSLGDLKLILYSIFDVKFSYLFELLYYWYYQFNFNIYIYIKILLYYFFYYIYLNIYLTITPFIFLPNNLFYYFWHIYVHLLLIYKIIIYYIYILYIYILPYYFYPYIINIIFYLLGLNLKYNYLFNLLYLNNIINYIIFYKNFFLSIYIFISKLLYINIVLFLDIFFNNIIFYNIIFFLYLVIIEFITKIIKIYYNYSLSCYFWFLHLNIIEEVQIFLDKWASDYRVSRLNLDKFNLVLENNFYLYKTRILGMKILSPMSGEFIDYYKTFRPIFFFRGDSLQFFNNNYFIIIVKSIRNNIFNINNFILLNDITPIVFRSLKYYFIIFYLIFYIIFRFIIINNNKYEYNLHYNWSNIKEDYIKDLNRNKNLIVKDNIIDKLIFNKYVNLNKNLLNIISFRLTKYIINKINLNNIYTLCNKDLVYNNIKLNNFKIILNNIKDNKIKDLNYQYVLNKKFDQLTQYLLKDYYKNKYVYNFYNLQNNIFEEEYYYTNKTINKFDTKYLENIHKDISNKIINYFTFIDKVLFRNIGPNWLLNKSYSTLFFNKSLGTEVILMPYVMASTEGFYWMIFLPFILYYFIFYISSNFYSILDIQEYFFYTYFYIFIDNIEFIYNFQRAFLSGNDFVEYQFNFFSITKESINEDFMFFFSEKIYFFDFLKQYKNLYYINNYNNNVSILYYNPYLNILSNKISNFYIIKSLVIVFILFLFIIKKIKKINTITKDLDNKIYFKFIMTTINHYKFKINKRFIYLNK